MKSGTNSILIHEADDVATALLELHRGDSAKYSVSGRPVQVEIREDIPRYHKFAVRNIRKSERVLKYGEVIGEATCDILAGTHVHTHNLRSPGRQS
jgi:altronate dehydratase